MKKIILCIILGLVINGSAIAKGHGSSHSHCSSHCHCSSHHHSGYSHRGHNYYHSSSGDSHPVYLINEEYKKENHKFPDCDKHYVTTETLTNYYSDGSKRVLVINTIYKSDGTPIVENCQMVDHVLNNNKHYFVVNKNRIGQIIDENGKVLSERKYSYIEVLNPNRFLVRLDKKYGVIDIAEKNIVPVKYQKFDDVGCGLYITKLNGYYGILDVNNNNLVENDCERIKPLYDTYVLKRYGKYGLVSKHGKLLLEPTHDKIKSLGEYILVKDNQKYSIFDMFGNCIDDKRYKKVRLERNTLQGMDENENWSNISTGLEYKKE